MRIALGADDDGDLPAGIAERLRAAGHEVVLPTPFGSAWPDVGRAVGEAVVGGSADVGIVCCWTGTGVSIAANKVPGARAALCTDVETATGARRWNDANVLALSMARTSLADGMAIVEAFLRGEPDDEERPNFSRLG
jgi:ribose 5-phosphate isomerase B